MNERRWFEEPRYETESRTIPIKSRSLVIDGHDLYRVSVFDKEPVLLRSLPSQMQVAARAGGCRTEWRTRAHIKTETHYRQVSVTERVPAKVKGKAAVKAHKRARREKARLVAQREAQTAKKASAQ